ncbi:hypothetical protein CI610_03313 [invertebrate metagenome]|uniref:Uncharacterized protein n=1 Tax=invertebrate metagenome TaxID=1711999 RepID=A0A2H9T3J3_9ZZZZ
MSQFYLHIEISEYHTLHVEIQYSVNTFINLTPGDPQLRFEVLLTIYKRM